MLLSILKMLHVLAVVLWVGGMMFMRWFLHPALLHLSGPQRIVFVHAVLTRFFRGVLLACVVILATGAAMLFQIFKVVGAEGTSLLIPWYWIALAAAGLVMIGIFLFIRFVLYVRLSDAIRFTVWDKAARLAARIGFLAMINLWLGIGLICLMLLA